MAEEAKVLYTLDTLYKDVHNLVETGSSERRIEITPIAGDNPIICFTVFVDHEPLAIIFNKAASHYLAVLKVTALKDVSFKYYIQQELDGTFTVVHPSDLADLQDEKLSVVRRKIAKTYTHSQLRDFLQLEFQTKSYKIARILKSVAKTHNSDNRAISRFLSKISDKIGVDPAYLYPEEKGSFAFSKDDEKEFHRLFFLNGSHVKKICRYCSLESLYQMLSNQTIRLNGLVGMNDKSEYRYAWNTFFGDDESTKEMEEEMNRTYIMSCSSMNQKDDLEMWRLYGDDGKGVCLIFEVATPNFPFILAKTIYEYTRDGKMKIKDTKWEMLKQIVDELKGIGCPLEFSDQNKWLSFLKSGDYCYEQEVRLLYAEPKGTHKSKQWVLTKTNSILNPYVEFDLLRKKKGAGNIIPLTLQGIILGPKCAEKEVNAKQIENLLLRDDLLNKMNIEVQVSEITNYR